MKYETFVEKFNELPIDTKIAIYREYCIEYGDPDETLEYFDEEFFNIYFENKPMEAARAVFFGNIENWADDYIKFNAYGNLESVSEYTAENIIEDNIEEIFEYKEIWQDYIEDDEDDNEEND